MIDAVKVRMRLAVFCGSGADGSCCVRIGAGAVIQLKHKNNLIRGEIIMAAFRVAARLSLRL
jgi:hypothetical protein